MHYYEVAPNQIVRTGSGYFTYYSKKMLLIGQIVLIEVGKRNMVGVVIKKVNQPNYDTKPIISLLEESPIPSQLIELALWISNYYVTPLALVIQTILPNGIQKTRRIKSTTIKIAKRKRTNILFNDEQLSALSTLDKYCDGTFLLQGVTGSGKTEVYIEATKKAIKNNQSVIIIVPEIALTSQIISEFSNHFNDLLLTHSAMREADRHLVWRDALNSNSPKIVIGPRSALFTPLKNIGLIVIDEAHEPSLKQEQSPRYSALRVATMLGRFHKSKVIFGTATPNIVDRYLAEKSNRPLLRLNKPARKNTVKPLIELIDMKNNKNENFKKHHFLSDKLLEQIELSLKLKKQTLIFHNKRGSTTNTLCKECGWTAECLKCHLPLSLHIDKHKLLCHICGFNSEVMSSCEVCNSTDIIHKGIGTKLIESELKKFFPNAIIARFDSDNKNDDSLNTKYKEIYEGKIDIIIGTQIVAKGLDLPKLRTVGVIQADSGLSLPDYSSSERTFQLLSQVVGRVGRCKQKDYVIIQSYLPKHFSIACGILQDYETFYKNTLKERIRGNFPPICYLLKLTCSYKTEVVAIRNSKKLFEALKSKVENNVQIFGPTPAFYERQYNNYRWQLVLKSSRRENLSKIIKYIPTKNWQYELDPTSLL